MASVTAWRRSRVAYGTTTGSRFRTIILDGPARFLREQPLGFFLTETFHLGDEPLAIRALPHRRRVADDHLGHAGDRRCEEEDGERGAQPMLIARRS
jgi:hypothetical protein